jgi:hypothetical protein
MRSPIQQAFPEYRFVPARRLKAISGPREAASFGRSLRYPLSCLNVFGNPLWTTAVQIARHCFPQRFHTEATGPCLSVFARKRRQIFP